MIVRALSFYILRTLARHRRTSMFFAIWVPWGDAGFFALFASGRLSWLLLCWIWAPAGAVFVPPGWILCPLGLHFESFESLWCEPEAPGARHREKFEKVLKMKRLGSLIDSFLGHIFESAASQNRADKRFVALFCQSFFESVSCSVPEGLFR
jgi:hypothetical protein